MATNGSKIVNADYQNRKFTCAFCGRKLHYRVIDDEFDVISISRCSCPEAKEAWREIMAENKP